MLYVVQDLLREFIKRPNYKWSDLPEKVLHLHAMSLCSAGPGGLSVMVRAEVAVQMNDTHPTIAADSQVRV